MKLLLPAGFSRQNLPAAGRIFFYLVVLILIFNSRLPALPEKAFLLRERLFREQATPLPAPGQSFSIFKPFIAGQTSVGFIMDYPYHPYGKTIEKIYSAQAYLAPTIVNSDPSERIAIVDCSSKTAENKRLEAEGYERKLSFSEGKSLAVKK